MATSQIRVALEHDAQPKFKDAAEVDESARWEAYVALQARKRRSDLPSSFESEIPFDPHSPYLVGPRAGGSTDWLPNNSQSSADDSDNSADLGAPDMASRGDRRWRTLGVIALAIVAGGVVVAASLLSRAPGVSEGGSRHAIAPAAVAPAMPISQPITPPISPVPVPAEAPTRARLHTARPALHHHVLASTRARNDQKPQHRLATVSWPRSTARLQPVRSVHPNPAASSRAIAPNKTEIPAVVGAPNPRVKPDLQQREAAASEHPAASQRLTDYRASQTAYERELKSYNQAMALYHERVAADRPAVPRRPVDPESALDSLPWRR